MDDLVIALLVYLVEESSEDESYSLKESEMFKKKRITEDAFQILVRRYLNCNDEKFRQ